MWSHFERFFAPPVFPTDEGANRRAQILFTLLAADSLVIAIWTLATIFVFENKIVTGIGCALLWARLLFTRALARRGQIRQASLFWAVGMWLFITVAGALTGRIGTTAVTFHLAITAITGILLGRRATILVAAMSCLVLLGMAVLETQGYPMLRIFPMPPISQWFILIMAVIFTIVPLLLTIQGFEDALARAHKSEQRYVSLFDIAPVMYLIIRDPSGVPQISDCNAAFLNTLGYRREQVVDQSLTRFYSPASQAALRVEQAQRGWLSAQPLSVERELVAADGRNLQTLLQVAPERDSAGQVIGILAMYVDVTARKQAQMDLLAERALLAKRVEERTTELSRANAELERALHAKDAFLATMSHELRTPLNAILGLSESLLEQYRGPLSNHQRRMVTTIESSGHHLLDLINDILDLSKVEAGHMDLQYDTILIAEVCQSSLRFVKEQAIKRNLQLTFQLNDHPAQMQADPRRMKQILVNLLSNAVKFTEPGGRVSLEVTADSEAGIITFVVKDTGIGIAPESLSQLFQPFVQLDSRLSRQYAGTGLGLALVRRLADLHGGSVSVESEQGKGSRFAVALPFTRSEIAAVAALPASSAREIAAALAPTPARILIVEDNEFNIIAISDYLQDRGYQLTIARNGREALALTEKTNPQMILMDIQIPEIDGLEVTRQLRAKPAFAETPIIALTALAMPGDRERCLAAGANAYLTKPVSMKGLVETIQGLLQA